MTPRISANDYIWLRVVPDVSSYAGVSTETIGGAIYQADIFNFRHIETQVLIPNANTLVMGGMVSDSPTCSNTKIPVLGDIPVLGYAFRSENKSLQQGQSLNLHYSDDRQGHRLYADDDRLSQVARDDHETPAEPEQHVGQC